MDYYTVAVSDSTESGDIYAFNIDNSAFEFRFPQEKGHSAAKSETLFPFRFASKEEGTELMLANEEYYSKFSPNKLGYVMQNNDATMEEYLAFAKEQVIGTLKKVFPYILAGVGIGAVIHNWIPESWIETVLGGNNPFGVILATIVGIPMYADIFGTIPIAEALLAKGALLGTVLAFMMGVTTLSLPSMIMLKKAIKPKLLGIFILICTVGIILVGYGFNLFQTILL